MEAQGTGHCDAVIEDLIFVLDQPHLHYEAILGWLEVQRRRERTLALEYYGFYSWLVELVYYHLYFRQVNSEAFLHRNLPLYDGIHALVAENVPLWIFSLNHDVIVEALAARLSVPIHSGFSAATVTLPRRGATGKKTGQIRAEVLTRHELEHGAMHFPNPPVSGISLLKIHGALDEFTFNDGQDLLKLLPDAPGEAGVIDVLRAANEDLFYLLPGAVIATGITAGIGAAFVWYFHTQNPPPPTPTPTPAIPAAPPAVTPQFPRSSPTADHQGPTALPNPSQNPVVWDRDRQFLVVTGGGPDAPINSVLLQGTSMRPVSIKEAYAVSGLTGHKQELMANVQYRGYYPVDKVDIPPQAPVWLELIFKPPLSIRDFVEQWGQISVTIIYSDRNSDDLNFDENYIHQKLQQMIPDALGPHVTPR